MNEAILIEKAKRYEEHAFNVLYQKYLPCLLNQQKSFILTQQDREDLIQETFLRAFTKIHQFKGSSRFVTWLKRIHYHVIQTFFIKNKNHCHQITAEVFQTLEKNQDLKNEQFMRLAVIFKNLGRAQKQIIYLHCLEGRTYQEISERLCIPIGTVRSRIHRVKSTISDMLMSV